MKIGIFGAGAIARKAYLPLLITRPEVEIAGVYSRTQQTVDEACAGWHITYGTTHTEALIARGIDAAFVLTATPAHFAIARELLSAGIDVFLEKPATSTSQETQALAELARDNQRILMVGFNRRYAPLYCQAKEIFGARTVGMCKVEKHRPSAYHPSLWNNYLDDTIHQIDLLRYYCGDPQPLYTQYDQKAGKLTNAASMTRLPGGGMGMVLTSLEAGAWQEEVTLMGEGLTVQVSAFREMRVRQGDHETVYGNDRPGRWVPELTERGFTGAIEHFFQCVADRSEPQTNGDEAYKTQLLMEGLVAAAN